MDENTPNHLRIIGQLARDYEQKYKELEQLISEIPPDRVAPQLRALAERTTDRFRSAQFALLSSGGISGAEGAGEALPAATALCSAFDEMRILFQFLMQHCLEKGDTVS